VFDTFVRRDDSRRHSLTAIGIQFDARRKGPLSRSIEVRRDWPQSRLYTRRNGFASINVQLNPRRKRLPGIQIWRERLNSSPRVPFVQSHVLRPLRRVYQVMVGMGVVCRRQVARATVG